MTSLKILHTDFHRGWGGQAARVLMLSGELVRRGHEVTIAAPPGELARRTRRLAGRLPGLRIDDGFSFRSPSHLAAFVRDMRRMAALLRRERFDIIDVHGSQDGWVTAIARAATGLPGRLVLTRHNTKRVRAGLPNRLLYGRLVHHVILVDESIRGEYGPLLARGAIADSRMSVVSSAYRSDLFHPGVDRRKLRGELGLSDADLVIGVAGRLVLDKGHIHLFEAVRSLRAAHPAIVIVLAGAGPNERRLREQARELGLEAAVHFLGFRSDIAQVEASFDIAVLPSVGCDASSAVLKEAMALGVPVIATDVGGARHIIKHRETGLIVPSGDPAALAAALRSLIEDPSSARRMAERARARVADRFSVERLADGTLGAYERALADADRDREREPFGGSRRSA